MNFKKIFKSLDFRGNKIINVKTNTPVNSEDITNKEYVDTLNKYDTIKAQTYLNPFNFNWITAVYNKSIKQVLDDLLFPLILPIYLNPEYTNIELKLNNEFFNGIKKIIFEDREVNFLLEYEIDKNDRESTLAPQIIITDNNDNVTTINGLTTDNSGIIDFSFDFKNIKSIVLRKIFEESTIIKQNSYNVDYIPVEFTINYNLDYDIYQLIKDTYIISQPILFKNITLLNETQILDLYENLDIIEDDTDFIKDRQVIVPAGINTQILICLPIELIDENLMYFKIDGSLLDIPFDTISEDSLISKILTYYNSEYEYCFGIVDLGVFDVQTQIDFIFKNIR